MAERSRSPLPVTRDAWRRLRPLCGDRLGSVAALVGASVAAGLVEAGVLALVADVAAAMVTGNSAMRIPAAAFSAMSASVASSWLASGMALALA
jgi:hypothetical protein